MPKVNVRARPDTGALYLDFFIRGVRCREVTALKDTTSNRKRVSALAAKIQKEIENGTFDYGSHFPHSPRAEQFARDVAGAPTAPTPPNQVFVPDEPVIPTFADFAPVWYGEMAPQWKPSHRRSVQEVLDRDLLPVFGTRPLHRISKADVLGFRAELAKRPGRKSATLGAARINKVLCFLRQLLNEAADRFEFTPAFRSIKPLKQARSDVQPFTLEEVQRLLDAIRPDYRDYLTVRFFTGMRTGEINGLKWKYVDLDRGLILVREALGDGNEGAELKTLSSQREIEMLPMVRAAIENRLAVRDPACPWVFATRDGNPIDAHNFCNRIWYPLLRYLDLEKRRPYQTRHTAATLMLASGESPEWIARTMGHSTTAMLFKVYSRFVPNLTRQDGRAFAGLVHSRLGGEANASASETKDGLDPVVEAAGNSHALLAALRTLSPEELLALVARAQSAS